MRQGASLDIIAARLSDAEPEPEPEPEMEAEAETAARRLQQDSRSTSSASSPVPPDNDNEESDFFLGANDSQSSLGVPNIQDMQVADDECLPPVQRLPNEIQIAIFAKLSSTSDLLHAMLTCKRWARNAVDILWHRPSCSTWDKHQSICQTLSLEKPYFSYRDFVRRLNLSSLATKINDGSVVPFAECTRIERLTLTGCSNLTDSGLIALVANNSHLYSLDISLPAPTGDPAPRDNITEASIYAITAHCPRLQGLNISGCQRISNESLIQLARECRYIKRVGPPRYPSPCLPETGRRLTDLLYRSSNSTIAPNFRTRPSSRSPKIARISSRSTFSSADSSATSPSQLSLPKATRFASSAWLVAI